MQSLMYNGYRISGSAKAWDGKWNVSYEIEKQAEPLRRCCFVVGAPSVSAAETVALQQGVKEVVALSEGSEIAA